MCSNSWQQTPGLKFSPLTEVSFFGYDGEVRIVKDEALIAKVRQIMPQIMEMYDKNGWEMGLFYLENGHAEIRGMMELKEEFDVWLINFVVGGVPVKKIKDIEDDI